jgi:hypothetical protein
MTDDIVRRLQLKAKSLKKTKWKNKYPPAVDELQRLWGARSQEKGSCAGEASDSKDPTFYDATDADVENEVEFMGPLSSVTENQAMPAANEERSNYGEGALALGLHSAEEVAFKAGRVERTADSASGQDVGTERAGSLGFTQKRAREPKEDKGVRQEKKRMKVDAAPTVETIVSGAAMQSARAEQVRDKTSGKLRRKEGKSGSQRAVLAADGDVMQEGVSGVAQEGVAMKSKTKERVEEKSKTKEGVKAEGKTTKDVETGSKIKEGVNGESKIKEGVNGKSKIKEGVNGERKVKEGVKEERKVKEGVSIKSRTKDGVKLGSKSKGKIDVESDTRGRVKVEKKTKAARASGEGGSSKVLNADGLVADEEDDVPLSKKTKRLETEDDGPPLPEEKERLVIEGKGFNRREKNRQRSQEAEQAGVQKEKGGAGFEGAHRTGASKEERKKAKKRRKVEMPSTSSALEAGNSEEGSRATAGGAPKQEQLNGKKEKELLEEEEKVEHSPLKEADLEGGPKEGTGVPAEEEAAKQSREATPSAEAVRTAVKPDDKVKRGQDEKLRDETEERGREIPGPAPIESPPVGKEETEPALQVGTGKAKKLEAYEEMDDKGQKTELREVVAEEGGAAKETGIGDAEVVALPPTRPAPEARSEGEESNQETKALVEASADQERRSGGTTDVGSKTMQGERLMENVDKLTSEVEGAGGLRKQEKSEGKGKMAVSDIGSQPEAVAQSKSVPEAAVPSAEEESTPLGSVQGAHFGGASAAMQPADAQSKGQASGAEALGLLEDSTDKVAEKVGTEWLDFQAGTVGAAGSPSEQGSSPRIASDRAEEDASGVGRAGTPIVGVDTCRQSDMVAVKTAAAPTVQPGGSVKRRLKKVGEMQSSGNKDRKDNLGHQKRSASPLEGRATEEGRPKSEQGGVSGNDAGLQPAPIQGPPQETVGLTTNQEEPVEIGAGTVKKGVQLPIQGEPEKGVLPVPEVQLQGGADHAALVEKGLEASKDAGLESELPGAGASGSPQADGGATVGQANGGSKVLEGPHRMEQAELEGVEGKLGRARKGRFESAKEKPKRKKDGKVKKAAVEETENKSFNGAPSISGLGKVSLGEMEAPEEVFLSAPISPEPTKGAETPAREGKRRLRKVGASPPAVEGGGLGEGRRSREGGGKKKGTEAERLLRTVLKAEQDDQELVAKQGDGPLTPGERNLPDAQEKLKRA